MACTLTWLHLSDLHFSHSRRAYDQAPVLRSFEADIKRVTKECRLAPDLIFLTGDIAFGELKPPVAGDSIDEQFDGAFDLLERVRNAFSVPVPKDRIFIVPGNHDVKRSEVGAEQTAYLRGTATHSNIVAMIQSGDLTWQRMMKRLDAFAAALKRHGYLHLLEDSARLISAVNVTVSGVSVGIAGLNSAWSCSEDREKARVWMGAEWQLFETHNRVYKSDIRFLMSHHPFNWLMESENEGRLWRIAEKQFHFMLHGHEHDEWISFRENHTRIAAAATYDGPESQNGYNICRFKTESCVLDSWFRTYDPKGLDWIPHVIAGKTDSSGHLKHTMQKTPAARPRNTKTKRGARPIAFLAVPMAAVNSPEYVRYRATALKVMKALESECGFDVYYAGADIKTPDMFEPKDQSWRKNLSALQKGKIFILLFPDLVASSVLVEAGMALANGVPSLYLVRKGVTLPYMLNAASEAYPNVAVRRYATDKDLVKLLTDDGLETCKALIRGDKAGRK